jgi:hypothetical protein
MVSTVRWSCIGRVTSKLEALVLTCDMRWSDHRSLDATRILTGAGSGRARGDRSKLFHSVPGKLRNAILDRVNCHEGKLSIR